MALNAFKRKSICTGRERMKLSTFKTNKTTESIAFIKLDNIASQVVWQCNKNVNIKVLRLSPVSFTYKHTIRAC